MRKIFILLLFISSLFSYDVLVVKAKILSKIAHEVIKKNVVNIYVEDRDLQKTKGLVSSIRYTFYEEADIVFVSNMSSIKKNKKYIFSTSYYIYQNNPDILGAFFWQKGRPNIIIKSQKSKNLNISFSKSFQKYIE